jgi:hypothetical protein
VIITETETRKHIINVAMIQDIHPLEKPKYPTELASLMNEKEIEMKKITIKILLDELHQCGNDNINTTRIKRIL